MIGNENLPVSWMWVPLAELLSTIETGKSFKCDERPPHIDEVGVVKVSAVSWGEYQERESKTCLDADRVNPDLFIREGDFLFSRANTQELVGACVIARKTTLRIMLSDKILRFRLSNDAMKQWILDFLRSVNGRSQIEELASGNQDSMRNIGQERIGQILVPLAPTAEQARIIDKLEELFSDLNAGVAELKAAQAKLVRYRQSLLKAVVEGKYNDNPYPRVSLAELTREIGQGWSPKCEGEPALEVHRWGVIKTTAIQPQAFDGTHNKALPIGFQPRPHLELKVGDLLITRAGPRNRVGICCLVRATRQNLMLCDKAYRIRCNTSRVEAGFLELVLNAPQFVQQIDALKTGINDSGLNLTQDRFLAIKIPLPSLDRQRELMAEIESIEAMLREQTMSMSSVLVQSTAQRKNILRAAFSGQLVPQDPNDEPASALLARIRAQREQRVADKAPRRRKESA